MITMVDLLVVRAHSTEAGLSNFLPACAGACDPAVAMGLHVSASPTLL